MSKFKFIKCQDTGNEFDTTKVIHTVETVGLSEVIEAFEDFLKGCAFSFDGNLEIVEDPGTEAEKLVKNGY